MNRNHSGANRIINDAARDPHNQTADDEYEPQERLQENVNFFAAVIREKQIVRAEVERCLKSVP